MPTLVGRDSSNFSISPGNRLSTGEQRPPLMSRRCLRRPLSRDPDAVIVGAVHRCSNAPPGVIENLPTLDLIAYLKMSCAIMSHVADSPKNRHFEPISGRFTPIRPTNQR